MGWWTNFIAWNRLPKQANVTRRRSIVINSFMLLPLPTDGCLLHANLRGMPVEGERHRHLDEPGYSRWVVIGAIISVFFPLCNLIDFFVYLVLAQMIIFGTNDGIYYLNLQELADATLELVRLSI